MRRYLPVCGDNGVSERIHTLALGLVLYFRDAGSILLLLEFATHCGGLMWSGRER